MKFFKHKIPKFYCEILDYWFKFYSTEPNSSEHILREKLWNNKFILIDKKPVYHQNWDQHGIKYIDNIINDQGNFKTKEELKVDFDITINFMHYNSIKSAIPKSWLTKLKENRPKQVQCDNLPIMVISKGKPVDVTQL